MAYWRRICARLCMAFSTKNCLRVFIVLVLVTAASVYYNLFFFFTTNYLENRDFVGVDKCPACYGTVMCHEFSHGHLSLSSYSRMRFLDIVNVKNVFFGWHNEKNVDIILKRLAHDQELASFDASVCKNAGARRDCDVARSISQTKFSRVLETRSLEVAHVEDLSDVVRCPSQRLLERIWMMYKDHVPGNSLSNDQKMMLMTMLAVNPEPIIYMIFPKSEGWPFPQYYGACGRLIVEEYVGKTLGSYFNADWSKRLDLAYQVMKIAEQLTNNELEYALYLTDVSFDNFAVNKDGRVLIIDAENIIVVDKRKIKTDAKPSWNERHQSFHDECKSHPGCLSFSSELLCKRHSSDHNYYAMCHGLLAQNSEWAGTKGGLLHDPPANLPERERLIGLIAECEKPSQRNGRYDAMQQLLQLLSHLTDGM
ncbi:deleted in autism protein 1-like [Acanthaster planci]|uniref:Deleted in autism protein 1-like n=1 Tax=Acanthaster planci TaxID=133434 RepID=A0A8B7Y4F2_ACAPL|nr:deleted in autism protein 1-like [Acanthaster planci]XP_022088059.1 deleted in autism protein 1-like [Acanthaster planci]XP_022088060.1 deleted in autism protein 1-like [Acanthaster planci]XP_022088061.1 deleted in autism protein 1-like [Acanthaster planci]XP_022088062.1 deleted in autism protein 1-like [Acanthaster planci]XP_022088063.1 deleted in autism protein 1-like [Acanthaster planci]XP_022088064.1 deleted in autism protein 1-like [Acanthaster planci]